MKYDTYEMFRAVCPATIEVALSVVEDACDEVLHEWIEDADRGEWLSVHSWFFVLFKDGEYRGYACVVNYGDEHFLHFGTIHRAYSVRDVEYSMGWLRDRLPKFYGVEVLKCCIDSGTMIGKLIGKLGFTAEPDSDDIHSIKLSNG